VDRRTGILVRGPSGEAFAGRFFELLADRALRAEIRRQAHRDVLLNNDPERIYSRLAGLYARAVREEPLRAREVGTLFSYDRSFLKPPRRSRVGGRSRRPSSRPAPLSR
jgi:hypothetical protein